MAKKITDYTALTTPAVDDLMEIVDISDNTMSANGTNKKITRLNLTNNPYKCSAYANAEQTFTLANVSYTIQLDTENYDTNSNFNTGTYKYTCPVTGYYTVSAQIKGKNLAAGARLYITVTGDDGFVRNGNDICNVAGGWPAVVFHDDIYRTAGQTIFLTGVITEAGKGTQKDAAGQCNWMSIHFFST